MKNTILRTAVAFAIIIAIVALFTGCGTVEYRDRYTSLPLDKQLLQDYTVQAPPSTAVTYSYLDFDQKESLWTDYTNSLLEVIGKYQADKAGLRKADEEFQKKIEELNKKADKK